MRHFTLLCAFTLFSAAAAAGFDLNPRLLSRNRRSLESSLRTMYNNALTAGQELYRAAQAQASAARGLQQNQLQNPTLNTFYEQNGNQFNNGANRLSSSNYGTGSRQNVQQNAGGRIQGWQAVSSMNPGSGWKTVTLGYSYGPKVIISSPTGIIRINGGNGIINRPIDPRMNPNGIVNRPLDPRMNPNGIINRPVDPRMNPNGIVNRPIDPRMNPNGIVNRPIDPRFNRPNPVDPRFGNTPINNLGPKIPVIPSGNPFIPVNGGGIALGPQPIALGLTQNDPTDPIGDSQNDPLVFTRQSDKWFWGGNMQTGPLRGAVPPQNAGFPNLGLLSGQS